MAHQNRVHRQASAVVALAALAAILGSAASGATALPTTSRANADAIVIWVLRPQADKGEVILVDVVFRQNGTIDYRRSDLNGNGTPDGED